jgi:hypothetical protein
MDTKLTRNPQPVLSNLVFGSGMTSDTLQQHTLQLRRCQWVTITQLDTD